MAYRVTVHGAIPPSPVCLAFSTLYHISAILSSTFFRVLKVALSAYSPPFPTGHSTGRFVPVAVWNHSTVHGLYHISVGLSRGSFHSSVLDVHTVEGSAFRFPSPVCAMRSSVCHLCPCCPCHVDGGAHGLVSSARAFPGGLLLAVPCDCMRLCRCMTFG